MPVERPENEAAGSPWSRADRLAFALLLAGALGSLPFLVHPYYDQNTDAALYVLTARSLAAGQGYSYLGEPFVVRPPGLPALLVPCLALFGTSFAVLNTLIASSGVLAVALLFVLFRGRLGPWLALASCSLLWCSPMFRHLSTQVMSDVPGLASILLALVLERRALARPTPGRHVLLGLALAAAMYLRAINVLLIPAMLGAAGLRAWRGPERGLRALRGPLLAVGVAVVAVLPWVVRNASVTWSRPPEQTYLHTYGTAMSHAEAADPDSPELALSDFVSRAPLRLRQVLIGIGGHVREEVFSWRAGAVGALVLLGALVALVRRRGSVELLAVGTVAALSVHFGYATRLALPFYALGVPLALDTLLALAGRRRGHVAALLTPLLIGFALLDYVPERSLDEIARAQHEKQQVVQALDELFPPGAPVACPFGCHLALFTPRPIYSLQVVGKRESLDRSLRLIPEHGIVGVLANSESEIAGEYLVAFRQHMIKERAVGSFVIFRVPLAAPWVDRSRQAPDQRR